MRTRTGITTVLVAGATVATVIAVLARQRGAQHPAHAAEVNGTHRIARPDPRPESRPAAHPRSRPDSRPESQPEEPEVAAAFDG